jgi:predicted O-methyltransferase YrrM
MQKPGPETILNLARNFMECRILLTGAELDLFTLLNSFSLSAQEVASRVGANLRALTILLDGLAAMGLLVKQEDKYQCSPVISPLLSTDSPDTILPMVLHMAHLWERWSALTNTVQGSGFPERPAGVTRNVPEQQAFIEAMHVIAAPQAPRIVAAVGPGSSGALLDVGGGSGTYTLAFLQAVPEMKATLFDRPEVVEMARKRMEDARVLNRVTLVSGDFYRDELPPGHDLAFLSAIIHQNSPGQNLTLFIKVFRSLERAGRIVIRDHVMSPDRTRPKDGAIFAVNMLLGTTGGGTYTFEEIKEGLRQAGFIRVRLLQAGEHMDALIEAFKP